MKILKGISKKADGNMKVGSVGSEENRRVYLNSLGFKSKDLVLIGLVHGNKVAVVSNENKGNVLPECDGFVTDMPGIILGVTAADCVPIWFWNKQGTVVGVAHAGWRGVQSEIVKEMIKLFVNKYNCLAGDIMAEIGPHIKDCHFEVKDDLIKAFFNYPESVKKVSSISYLNLEEIIIKQLVSVGVKNENIIKSTECTYCSDKYFSYRRDKPVEIQAMLAYIMLNK
jgi:YfiH family protein